MRGARAIGIDFGVSTSAVAALDADGVPRVLADDGGATTMPSMVGFVGEGAAMRAVVGAQARELALARADSVVYGIKRLLGRRHDDPDVQHWAKGLPFAIVAAANGDAWVRVRGIEVSPQTLAAMILRELRAIAERRLGETVTGAVVTVPTWFDAAQRQALRTAVELAGLHVRRLIGEPAAAALGHGAHRGPDRRYAIADLGGATFDVSICDVGDGIFEVLASAGDSTLGGDDIDRVIVEHLAQQLRIAPTAPLRAEARRIKHALTEAPTVELAAPLTRVVRRDEIELWSAPVLRRLEAPCRAAVVRAGATQEEIDEVLLVGGMTRMPAVRRRIAQVFGRDPVVIPNPDEAVALGAAVEIARLDGAFDGLLLLDVTGRGLAIGDSRCEVVIPAGSVVPTREHRVIPTTRDRQRELTFAVWEGEAEEPSKNRLLARYQVKELPEAPAGEVLVLVELTVDVDGMCRVTAQELVSGERPPVQVVAQSGLARSEMMQVASTMAAWRQ